MIGFFTHSQRTDKPLLAFNSIHWQQTEKLIRLSKHLKRTQPVTPRAHCTAELVNKAEFGCSKLKP